MTGPRVSPVWPMGGSDPNATSLLSVEDFVEAGGAIALRRYIAERLAAIEGEFPGVARIWASFAIDHLRECAGDETTGGIEVGRPALHVALAYLEWLEADRERRA